MILMTLLKNIKDKNTLHLKQARNNPIPTIINQLTEAESKEKTIDSLTEVDEDKLIESLMGITDFETTKNKSHVDSDLSGIFKGSQMKRKFRQYMNRKGGFNRTPDTAE